MGLYIDRHFLFKTHIKNTTAKAKNILNKLAGITRNVPHVSSSYVWRQADVNDNCHFYHKVRMPNMGTHTELQTLLKPTRQHKQTGCTKSNRTAPTTAILVIAKIAPIKLTIKEIREVYQKGSGFVYKKQDAGETYSGKRNGKHMRDMRKSLSKTSINGAKLHGQERMSSSPIFNRSRGLWTISVQNRQT